MFSLEFDESTLWADMCVKFVVGQPNAAIGVRNDAHVGPFLRPVALQARRCTRKTVVVVVVVVVYKIQGTGVVVFIPPHIFTRHCVYVRLCLRACSNSGKLHRARLVFMLARVCVSVCLFDFLH